MIDLITTYPVSFFLMTGILVAVILTIVEERNRNKNNKN
jgi:hypothetical protein